MRTITPHEWPQPHAEARLPLALLMGVALALFYFFFFAPVSRAGQPCDARVTMQTKITLITADDVGGMDINLAESEVRRDGARDHGGLEEILMAESKTAAPE